MNGIIVINKPVGKTSHDMVYFLRRLTGIKKIGHTGTLDPGACGVLPMCIGKATKAADMLTAADKQYRAELILGKVTDTQDAEGKVISQSEVHFDTAAIEETVKMFVGETEQIPPMYSAVKVGGKKLYELARKGIEIEREKRKVTIYGIDIISFDEKRNAVSIDVQCSKGTYIRTLCADIGERLGCGAYMNTLERTKSGVFTIQESYTPEELVKKQENGELEEVLIPLDRIFADLEKVVLSEKQSARVKDGVRVSASGTVNGERYRVYGSDGELLCVSRAENDRLVIEKTFW